MYAETIASSSLGLQFGAQSVYDELTKTLFVGAPGSNSVYAFANDGLYWRPLDLDGNEKNGITPWTKGHGFGSDMEVSGKNIVIGAPGEDKAYIYQRSGNDWTSQTATITVLSGSGKFGTSVAISGNTVVVGAPDTTVKYQNYGSPNTSKYVSIVRSGAAYTYTFSNAWGTTPTRMLMPDAPDLPPSFVDQSAFGDWETVETKSMTLIGDFSFDYNYSILDYKVTRNDGTVIYVSVNQSVYPEHRIRGYRSGFLGGTANLEAQGRKWVTKYSYNESYTSLDNAKWGSSVDILGNTVVVGAPGKDKLAAYDLTKSAVHNWIVQGDGITRTALRSSSLTNSDAILANSGGVGFGTDVKLISGSQILAGAPGDDLFGILLDSGRVLRYTSNGTSLSGIFTPINPQNVGRFGDTNTIESRGNIVLIGSTGSYNTAGAASLYNGSSTIELRPFKFNSNQTVPANDSGRLFGNGASIISDGFYVVGNSSSTENQQLLYTFRQRGPGWSSNDGLITIPDPVAKAKLGKSVAISGSTAVLAAPDYGNHGAVLIFSNVGTNREPQWVFEAQIESPGFQTGDEFGTSIAIQGDQLIVGAPGRNGGRGGATLYQRLNGAWAERGRLDGTVAGERAGTSVDIGSDYAAVGAPGVDSAAVYVLEKLAGAWSLDSRLVTTQSGNQFGSSVHLESTSLFIGAPNDSAGRGAVFVYSLSPNPQRGVANVSPVSIQIPATGLSAGDRFGSSIDGSGNFVVVGAPGTASNAGAAYVFDRRPTATTSWIQTRLGYSNGAAVGDKFGTSVAIDGVQIVVGAPGRTVSGRANQGEAFSYGLKNNGVWTLETPADIQDHVLTGAGAAAGDQVGYSVAISGDFALLGAPQLLGRDGKKDTDGSGYAFVRQINPPSTKTLPETQSVLVEGASTNTIAGSIANNLIPTLQFFDIQDVRLKTSSANNGSGQPIISTLTIQPDGFTAYGLQKFSAEGNITFTNLAPNLKIPTDGLFEFIPNVDLSGTAPIAIDLDGNGLEFVSRSKTGPKFDWNGTGTREATAWLGGNDGWLFVDQSADVQVTRQELSFVSTVPTAKSDLDALRIAYDSNKDNVLDSKDADWSKFKIWRDINLDGITTANEILGLDALGIVSIGLIGDSQSYLAAAGGVKVLGQATFTRANGSLGIVGDVVLNPDIGTVAPGSDRVVTSYDFIGGPAATYIADADTDWTLYDGFLTASDGRQGINLNGFNNVVLRGESGNNRIEVLSWTGNVTIDGGSGRDTIILRAGSAANVTILDSGAEDQLDIEGTSGADQILVTPTTIDVFPNGSPTSLLHVNTSSAMTGRLRISGGDSNDVITLNGMSFSTVELDGGEGLDTYNLFKSGSGSHTFISDSGANDGTRDKIKVLVNGPTVVNGFMNQTDVKYNNPNAPLTYDNSIEDIEVKVVDPKLFLTGNGFFRVSLDLVVFNGASYPLAGVTDLTITTTGDGSTIQVDQIPLTLTTLTVNASAGTGDTVIGTEQNNQWVITDADSGYLTGSPNLNFTGVENLRGRSGTDRFTFNASGSIRSSIDGGDGSDIVDYSSQTSGITIDLGNGSFSNIETLIGGKGTDTLIGPDANTDWNVLGAGTGSVAGINFSFIENLTGGDADDMFHLDTNSQVLGAINGGAGENRLLLRLSDAADVVSLSAPIVTSNGIGTTYSNIQTLELFTFGGQDNITVSPTATGFPESINIESGEADDRIAVNLLAGVGTAINIDGGAPSASDLVTVNGTNGADTIDVNGSLVSSGSTSISLVAVENLVINGGDAEDMISLTGTSVTGSIQLNGNGGDDRFEIAHPMSADSLQVDGGGSSADALAIAWTNQNDEITVRSNTVETTGETSVQYTGIANLILNTFGGEDNVVVAQTHTGSTELNTGEGKDAITVVQTSGGLGIDAGRADDAIRVRAIGAVATIRGGDGEDTISVGSAAHMTGGVLSGIQALLTIAGDAELDSLNIDSTGDTASNSGNLTSSRLTGLGMPAGIAYTDIDAMNIALGEFKDDFDIVSTSDNMVLDLKTGDGADVVYVRSINGSTTVDAGEGADTIHILPSSAEPVESQFASSNVSSAINGLLTVIGGDGNSSFDMLNFTSSFASVESGRLTQNRLTGLQMPEGVNYSGWESLNIALPIDAGIAFTIESTHAGTTKLTTGIGVDTVHVQSIAGATTVNTGSNADTVNVGSTASVTGGNVNAIAALLTLQGDGDSDTLNVDDSGDSLANVGTLTNSSLRGLGMASGIDYLGFETLRVDLGRGDDTLTVSSTHAGGTTLNTSAGKDTLNLLTVSGPTFVNTQQGNDAVNVQSISAPTIIHSGDGDDTVNVGNKAPATSGTVNLIGAILTVQGDANSDTLNVDDGGDTISNAGILTATTLTGLGMGGSITYGGQERLVIDLGSVTDTMLVNGTHAGSTVIRNRDGKDTVRMVSNTGEVLFQGGPDDDKLLLDPNYIHAVGNDPLITFTKIEDGRQRAGFWSFNPTQGKIYFESVERFNFLSKLVTPVGKIRTNQQGIEVTAPAVDEDYSGLVANFTVGPIQPLIVDSRAFGNPDFVKVNADADGDGNLSPLDVLVVVNLLNGPNKSLYRSSYDVDKDGHVTALDVLTIINRLNQPTTYVAVGGEYQITTRDLNNDGLAEIIVAGSVNSRPVLITLNGVTGSLFDAPIYLSDKPSPFTTYVTAADIDGDGILEIIVSSERGPGKYSIYRRVNGQLVLSAERNVPFDDGYIGGVRVAAGDLNGDGKDEILVGSGVGADASVRAYDASGQMVSTFVLPSSFARAGVLLKTGDYNGDGLLDLFVSSGRRGSSQVAVFDGRSPIGSPRTADHLIDNIFTDPSLIAPMDIALGDSDGDELDELFIWQLSDGRNQGVKQFKYDKAVDRFFEEF